MSIGKELSPVHDITSSSIIIFDAEMVEISLAKPAVPQELPKRKDIPETPSPIPDRRPITVPKETPVLPSSPIKEPALPAKIPVPSH